MGARSAAGPLTVRATARSSPATRAFASDAAPWPEMRPHSQGRRIRRIRRVAGSQDRSRRIKAKRKKYIAAARRI